MSKIKIVTVIGARPQFIKAAALNRAIRTRFAAQLEEKLLHTGQHYDPEMSQVFFEELSIPKEDYNLGIGSASHGIQTAEMMKGIEYVLMLEQPDALLVYGDTNSTLAASMVAAKMLIPIIHVEAGIRSWNKVYPEEVNRICTDHVSTLLFVPTQQGLDNMPAEGFNLSANAPYSINNPGVFLSGDIMYDNTLHFAEVAKEKVDVRTKYGLESGEFALATVHRNTNTDDPAILSGIFQAFDQLSKQYGMQLVLPLHPRTKKLMEEALSPELLASVKANKLLKLVAPASFLEMTALEAEASIVLTDSGGVQKEAYYLQKPCVILMKDTPWPELPATGSAIAIHPTRDAIVAAFETLWTNRQQLKYPALFGSGDASGFICQHIVDYIPKRTIS